MRRCNLLLLPRCEVAEQVIYCWHDVIKNKIQTFNDSFLQRWLDDEPSVEAFQTALAGVIRNLEGFSPAQAAAKLRPIACMQEGPRMTLLAALEEAFQRGFDVPEIRKRLYAVIDPLTAALQECRSTGDGSGRAESLSTLRKTAIAVRRELETLPGGFWLPGNGQEARRA